MDNICACAYRGKCNIGEGDMKPSIVSFSPFSFPNGGAFWSCHLASFRGATISVPTTDLSTIHGVYGNYHFDDEIRPGDYTIVGGPPYPHTKEVTEVMHSLSRPLLVMLHDVNDMTEKCRPFWEENEDVIDGFIVSNDETYHRRPSFVAKKPYLRTRLPYDPVPLNLNLDGKDNQRVCVLGRITPDKGARQVAMLTDYGFTVYVMGQKIELEEYHEYYKRIEATGAIVVPNPTNKEKRDILGKSSFYVSFTYQVENEVIVEYCLPKEAKVVKYDEQEYVQNGKQVSRRVNKHVSVKDVRVGDYILSYNEERGIKEWDKVVNTHNYTTENWIKIKFSNGNEIVCTHNHPLAVINNGGIKWVKAKDVELQDECIQYICPGLHWRIKGFSEKGVVKDTSHMLDKEVRGRAEKAKKRNHGDESEYRQYLKGIGKRSGDKQRGKTYEELYGVERARNIKKKVGKANSEAWERRKQSDDYPEFIAKWMSKHTGEKNALEEELSLLLDSVCPKEFEYNGNGELGVVLNGGIPDFVNINGKKKVIEVFAAFFKEKDYGSVEIYQQIRSKQFRKVGFDTLFVESKEFYDTEKLMDKVKSFVYNPSSHVVRVTEKIFICVKDTAYSIETENNHNFYTHGILTHNSVLEAMNHGCYPVVANWMTKYFELGGLYFAGVENTQDAASNLKRLINLKERDKELFDAKIISNYNNVLHWFDRELDKIEDMVLTIYRENGWRTR